MVTQGMSDAREVELRPCMMAWKRPTTDEWIQLGFVALLLTGIIFTIIIVLSKRRWRTILFLRGTSLCGTSGDTVTDSVVITMRVWRRSGIGTAESKTEGRRSRLIWMELPVRERV